MAERFLIYHQAYDHAVELARQCAHDVAIRAVKEYGQLGYNVALASITDSDYARAEIVRASDSKVQRSTDHAR